MAKKTISRRQSRATPFVLIVDDNDGDARATKFALGESLISRARSPNDVSDIDLSRADLVLLDFKLDAWPERDGQSTPSLKPRDGVALAAILRSNMGIARRASPTAFALRSGKLQDINGDPDYRGREHVIARSLELEWAFSKGMDVGQFASQAQSLAVAVKQFPRKWPSIEKGRARLFKLLMAEGSSGWGRRAKDEIESASPPEDVLAIASNGTAVLRWLLHEILPYPTFLLDERYLAARLRIDPSSLSTALNTASGKKIVRALRSFEYRGILHDFLGRRWWRAGIEHWLWSKTHGRPQNTDALRNVVKAILPRVQLSSLENPVVAVDDRFRPTDTLVELRDAVQVNSDDWPKFADSAWVSMKEARANQVVASQVVSQDRERLQK